MADEDLDALKEDRRRLSRKRMADGGEVVQGALAEEALNAVNARAMTLDHTIIVGKDFDPHAAEDQALYAHEKVHLEASGGAASHHGDHDAEEQAARAKERMVLHQAQHGDHDDHDGHDDHADASAPPAAPSTQDDPMQAYHQLRADGLSHDAVVRKLARDVISAMLHQAEEQRARGGHR